MAAACGGDGFLWYKKVNSISISPADSSLPAGCARQFAATAVYNDHRKVDVTDDCAWSSSNPEVVAIDAAGCATGVAEGSAVISATFDKITGNVSLTITRG